VVKDTTCLQYPAKAATTTITQPFFMLKKEKI